MRITQVDDIAQVTHRVRVLSVAVGSLSKGKQLGEEMVFKLEFPSQSTFSTGIHLAGPLASSFVPLAILLPRMSSLASSVAIPLHSVKLHEDGSLLHLALVLTPTLGLKPPFLANLTLTFSAHQLPLPFSGICGQHPGGRVVLVCRTTCPRV